MTFDGVPNPEEAAHLREALRHGLPLWVIYFNPKDAPDRFVLRRQIACRGQVVADPKGFIFETLEEAHAALPPGLFQIDPRPDDDPVILEIWV